MTLDVLCQVWFWWSGLRLRDSLWWSHSSSTWAKDLNWGGTAWAFRLTTVPVTIISHNFFWYFIHITTLLFSIAMMTTFFILQFLDHSSGFLPTYDIGGLTVTYDIVQYQCDRCDVRHPSPSDRVHQQTQYLLKHIISGDIICFNMLWCVY